MPANGDQTQRSSRIYHDFGSPGTSRLAMEMADQLRIRIMGFYYSQVGPEWSTRGRPEGDYLHHVNMVVAGDARVIHSTGTMEYIPGHAYWSPGNMPMHRECDTRLQTYFIIFRFEWLGGFDPFMDWAGKRPVDLGPWQGVLDPTAWDPARGLTTREAWRLRAQLALWLADSLPEMEEVLALHQRQAERFRPVLEALETTLGADLRIEELARMTGLTARAFSMAFTRALGISPKAYLGRRLNQEAIRLVLHSGGTMKEVSAKLRFTDEYHFNRFFKKMNGQPPMRYRALHISRRGQSKGSVPTNKHCRDQ